MPCELRSEVLTALVHPEAGMVVSSLRHRGEELLEQRGGLPAWVERGSTFGVPLLHPWANRLAREYAAGSERIRRDANGLPIHGLLHAAPFGAAQADGARVRASLDFPFLDAFPHPHSVEVTVELERARLTVTTALRNTGDGPLPIAFGWHPWLRLPPDPVVHLPVARRVLLDGRGLPSGASEPVEPGIAPLGGRSFDDLFDVLAAPARFALEGGGRRVDVAFLSGYPVAQVFRPPDADFICFEPMTAPTNGLISGDRPEIAPGRTYTARFCIEAAA